MIDAIDMKTWRQTPCVSGGTATDEDVNAGRAVFAVRGEPVELDLPACAIVTEEDIGEPTPVIVIQPSASKMAPSPSAIDFSTAARVSRRSTRSSCSANRTNDFADVE